MSKLIIRKHFLQLDQILWDNHLNNISEQEAFNAYETRWHYIEQDQLSTQEKHLIHRLTQEYGKGVFLSR